MSLFDDLFKAMESDMRRAAQQRRNRFGIEPEKEPEPEPEIADDRLIHPGPLDLCIVFKQCRHHFHIPSYVFNSMKDNREIVNYLNSLTCPDCQREWRKMEETLRDQHIAFEKRGGKL